MARGGPTICTETSDSYQNNKPFILHSASTHSYCSLEVIQVSALRLCLLKSGKGERLVLRVHVGACDLGHFLLAAQHKAVARVRKRKAATM